jgi:hypothetical protein
MRYLFILFLISLSLSINAQEDKTVTLVVSGQGATQEEARQKALRGAIEQAFGAFISSKTEILNDNLVKDEIVSVANGNIQKFDIVSETLLPNNLYVSTLNATVSLSKLTTFCQSKGISIEFKGSLFAQNMIIQELYEKNEVLAWENTKNLIMSLMKNGFDYVLEAKEPSIISNRYINENGSKYRISMTINVSLNNNYSIALSILKKFCESISLNTTEIDNYKKAGKAFYTLAFTENEITRDFLDKYYYNAGVPKAKMKALSTLNENIKGNYYVFRNKKVADGILSLPWNLAEMATYGIVISNGLYQYNLKEIENKDEIQIIQFENPYDKPTNPLIINSDLLKQSYDLFGGSETGSSRNYEKKFSKFIRNNSFPIKFSDLSRELSSLFVYNLINRKSFIIIKFNQDSELEEIKKMTEFKIVVNQ